MEFLSGWKEIAEHLHLGVRTAQRWERLGLPVRRVSDSPCSPVVAIPDELELWARTRDVRQDATLLASNKFLVSRLTALRETHYRTRRKTRRLLTDINSLGAEQRKLLNLIQASLNPTGTIDSRNGKRKSNPRPRPEVRKPLRALVRDEEIQSGNEELQSTNEELQTSKEELESANEELNTVNEEIQHRNHELAQLSNDLINLLNSATIPMIMLGPDLHIRRCTPEAERIFGFSNHDMGKALTHLPLSLDLPRLERWMLDVMRDVVMRNEQVEARDGKLYKLRITPYRTLENKIDGVVMALLDISDVIAGSMAKANR